MFRSQSADTGSISSLTFQFWDTCVGGPIIAVGVSVDNHGSHHTLTELPEPSAQPTPCSSKSRPIKMRRQPCEAPFGVLASKKEVEWQYFPSRVNASRLLGFFSILHESLAKSAPLNWAISQKPSPPAFFGIDSFSHKTQHIFRISGDRSHQNLVSTDWSCLTKD